MGYETSRSTDMPASMHAADKHFLDQSGRGYASNDHAEEHLVLGATGEAHQEHFTIFRVQSTSLTSTQFGGGDWRWRLSDAGGKTLVEAGNYSSEALCQEAVAILQARAGRATLA